MESAVKHWRRQKTVARNLGCEGSLLSWTTIHVAGTQYMSQTPFIVVMVSVSTSQKNGKVEEEKMVGQLVGCDSESELQVGQKVVSVLRKLRNSKKEDIIPYGIKFKRI